MEYVYAALLLHKLNKEVTEDNVRNVIQATGVVPDDIRVKALVAALGEINIDEALKAAQVPVAAVTPTPTSNPAPAQKEEEKEEKKEEEALEGLSALFG